MVNEDGSHTSKSNSELDQPKPAKGAGGFSFGMALGAGNVTGSQSLSSENGTTSRSTGASSTLANADGQGHPQSPSNYMNPLLNFDNDEFRTDLLSSGLRTAMLTVAKPGGGDKKKDSLPKYTGLNAKTINSCRKVTEFHNTLPLQLPL